MVTVLVRTNSKTVIISAIDWVFNTNKRISIFHSPTLKERRIDTPCQVTFGIKYILLDLPYLTVSSHCYYSTDHHNLFKSAMISHVKFIKPIR